MNKAGKLIRISDTLSIFILENEEGEYITEQGVIRFKNLRENLQVSAEQVGNCVIDEQGVISIMDESNTPWVHFPAVWLNTDQMKLISLVEKGLIKF